MQNLSQSSSPLISTTDRCTWLDNRNLWAACSCADMKAKMQKHSGKTASHALTESSQVSQTKVVWGTNNQANLATKRFCVFSEAASERHASMSSDSVLVTNQDSTAWLNWIRATLARWFAGDSPISPPRAVIRAPHALHMPTRTVECWPKSAITFSYQSEDPHVFGTVWQFGNMLESSPSWGSVNGRAGPAKTRGQWMRHGGTRATSNGLWP